MDDMELMMASMDDMDAGRQGRELDVLDGVPDITEPPDDDDQDQAEGMADGMDSSDEAEAVEDDQPCQPDQAHEHQDAPDNQPAEAGEGVAAWTDDDLVDFGDLLIDDDESAEADAQALLAAMDAEDGQAVFELAPVAAAGRRHHDDEDAQPGYRLEDLDDTPLPAGVTQSWAVFVYTLIAGMAASPRGIPSGTELIRIAHLLAQLGQQNTLLISRLEVDGITFESVGQIVEMIEGNRNPYGLLKSLESARGLAAMSHGIHEPTEATKKTIEWIRGLNEAAKSAQKAQIARGDT